MYRKLKQSAYASGMNKINQAILRLFGCLALQKYVTEELLRSCFKENYSDFWRQCERKSLIRHIRQIADFPLEERRCLYSAMLHDLSFTGHMEDAAYELQEKALSRELLQAVRGFTAALYRNFFQGFGVCADGERITYQKLRHASVSENGITACPVCLQIGEQEKYWQMDHYLPHAKYPLLAFHPDNLAVTCYTCNEQEKRARDPLKDSDLTEIFFPYHRAAQAEAEVEVTDVANRKSVFLVPSGDDAKTEKRIENLDRLYALRERWAGKLGYYLQIEQKTVREMDLDRRGVEAYLEMKAIELCIKSADHEEMLVEAACYRFFAGEGKGCFLEEWERRRKEYRLLSRSE